MIKKLFLLIVALAGLFVVVNFRILLSMYTASQRVDRIEARVIEMEQVLSVLDDGELEFEGDLEGSLGSARPELALNREPESLEQRID